MQQNSEHPDDTLILQLIDSQEKKELGFRYLVSKYKERLYWHIRRMVGNHEDADDVIQNTFVKVYRNIHTFQYNASLYTWLYRIATNESINFLKSKKSGYSLSDIQEFASANLKEDLYFDEQNALNKLKSAIDALPEKQKLVFNLRYYDEMSYEEIAQVTDTSVGALKASYHHAVKKIESFIKNTI
jgi:RNA polymerase sigma-70 factor (ECF subfamily)